MFGMSKSEFPHTEPTTKDFPHIKPDFSHTKPGRPRKAHTEKAIRICLSLHPLLANVLRREARLQGFSMSELAGRWLWEGRQAQAKPQPSTRVPEEDNGT